MSFRNRRSKTSHFLDGRKQRKELLLSMIEKNPNLELKTIRGLFSQQTGNKLKTIDEYLEELQDANLIEITHYYDGKPPTIKALTFAGEREIDKSIRTKEE